MYFTAISSLITTVSALRLITLNDVYERHRDVYIMNSDANLKFQRVTTDTIPSFYTVVHLRKLLFYTKGTYYGLVYNADGVRLKLGSIGPTKVQYYTQEIDGAVAAVDVKIPRWDLLLKGRGSDSGELIVDDSKGLPDREISVVTKNVSTGNINTKQMCQNQGQCEVKIRERSLPILRVRGQPDERTPKKKKTGTSQDDIESDSEMNPLNTLDIKLETVDSQKKTFVLKNDKSQCVTYFQAAFILSDCRKNKRQVFKLVSVDSVMEALQGGAGGQKKPEKTSEDEDTITLKDLGVNAPSRNDKDGRKKQRKGKLKNLADRIRSKMRGNKDRIGSSSDNGENSDEPGNGANQWNDENKATPDDSIDADQFNSGGPNLKQAETPARNQFNLQENDKNKDRPGRVDRLKSNRAVLPSANSFRVNKSRSSQPSDAKREMASRRTPVMSFGMHAVGNLRQIRPAYPRPGQQSNAPTDLVPTTGNAGGIFYDNPLDKITTMLSF